MLTHPKIPKPTVEAVLAARESNAVLMAADKMLCDIPVVTLARMAKLHGYVLVPSEVDFDAATMGWLSAQKERGMSGVQRMQAGYRAMVERVAVKIPKPKADDLKGNDPS